jgi:uncharacterized membrane protein
MSELVVVSYKGEDTADQVLNKLRELQKEYLVDLEDAVVVIRDKKGAGAGALSGALTDYGINDDFIKSVGKTLEQGSSALFILVRRVNLEKVLPELKPFGGTILKSSLTTEQEQRLKKALEDVNSKAAVAA